MTPNRWVIEMSDQVLGWLDRTDEATRHQIGGAIEALAMAGPQLGRPLVDTLSDSRFSGMKELRPPSPGRSEIRILFIFDPQRHAYLLLVGDKSGQWKAWYKKNIPLAERIYEEHLARLKGREV